jgi:acyl-CoA synthetase (AMP-forming)/AMP-acid ligase II
VIGRRDDLIISTGRNFFAHEIERVVNEVDGVVPGRCVALGIYSPAVGSQDIVVLAESDAADTPESGTVASRIRAAVSGAFGIALHATRLCRRGTLIKTSSGKISRSENLRLYVEQEAREVE